MTTWESNVGKTYHQAPEAKPKPRRLKRERQWKAMQPKQPDHLPLPDPAPWKPLG